MVMQRSKVLVCEDEALVAEDIRRMLEAHRFDVTAVVSSAEEALASASHVRPDVALMDIRLGGESSGIDAARELSTRHGVPCVFLTAFADEETIDRAKRTEPLGYLVKPFQESELCSTLEVGLYRHRRQQHARREIERYRGMLEKARSESRAADELIELQRQLLDVERMNAVRTLAGGVAVHMTDSIVFVDAVLSRIAARSVEGSEERQIVGAARERCRRLRELLRQMLWFGEQGSLEFEERTVSELLFDVLEEISPSVSRSIDVVTHLSPDPMLVTVDSRQMSEALRQLLRNAAESMPTGGVITVSSGLEYEPMPERFNPQAAPGWFVTIRVRDTGRGIAIEDQPRIFEPFFSTKPSGESFGLGLALVYGVMQNHGGWVSVISRSGEGSTLSLFLPQRLSDPSGVRMQELR